MSILRGRGLGRGLGGSDLGATDMFIQQLEYV